MKTQQHCHACNIPGARCERRAAQQSCACCVDPLIRQIVNRRHVGESNRTVIRYMASRMRGGVRAFLRAPRNQRRLAMAMVIHQHAENRATYRAVIGR